MSTVQALSLSKKFVSTVLDSVSFSVSSGEIFGIAGPDGAGKTTLLRILSTIIPPDCGDALLCNLSIITQRTAVQNRIGYMSQRFGLYPDLTVMENIRFYSGIFGLSDKAYQEKSARLLKMSGMLPFKERTAGRLSGGMKQKLALICTLIHTPEILILDEPTNGVDPVSRREFWGMLQEIAGEGITVLLSTVYLDEAERCDRIALLNQGRMMACDTPWRIRNSIPGKLLETMTPDSRKLSTLLSEIRNIRCFPLGDRLQILTDGKNESLELIRLKAQSAGMTVFLEELSPPLEIAFALLMDRI